ncbi:hypothetical protein HGP05_09795 [Streptococcus sanguinis]|uniref:CshA domain-containing protein n=1 Tax=Streptococcus sanguinis TaxID=1305 RepID=A0A7Y0VBQ3_STRSA|nr:hypothetical protein [Streptococcus sanguinis]
MPGQGTYTIAPDGTVTFTPDKQFVGSPDPVTVKRVDKNGTPVTGLIVQSLLSDSYRNRRNKHRSSRTSQTGTPNLPRWRSTGSN